MVVMGRAAPFTRSNRASGVGVIVKMHTSYPAGLGGARRERSGGHRGPAAGLAVPWTPRDQGRRAAIAWKQGQ